jgi:hypothetical protein
MRRLVPALFALAACQEFSIDKPIEEIPEPIDSDVPEPPATAPDIEVTPAELDFGYLPTDCPAEEQKVTITNVGDAPLEVSAVTLTGPDALVFTLAVNPRTLAPGESFKATLGFTAPAYDTYNRVKLVVASNDPDEGSVDVALFGAGAEDGIHEQAFLQTQASSVDVLFVIDNSGSMSDELDELARTFQTFITSFINLGLDYHIAVTTTDMDATGAGARGRFAGDIITNSTPNPVAEFTQQTTQGAAGSGDERGRDAAYAALTPPLVTGPNNGFLRTDANLAVVVVSDENDFSNDIAVGPFNNWLNNLKGDPLATSFSGMVGPDGAGRFACSLAGGSDATFAPRYHDVISGTAGVWSDICQFQTQVFLTFLSYVAAGLLFDFELDFTPSSVGSIIVEVDGVALPYSAFNGWTFDAATNRVTLHGSGVPGPGAVITIRYPFLTSCP